MKKDYEYICSDGEILRITSYGENNARCIVYVHGFKGFKDWGAWSVFIDLDATDLLNISVVVTAAKERTSLVVVETDLTFGQLSSGRTLVLNTAVLQD